MKRIVVAGSLAALSFGACILARAQDLMSGAGPDGDVRLIQTDLATLELQEPRKDLPCSVTPEKKAVLGFDLRLHAGYEVSVPLRELAGPGNRLTIIMRVTPEGARDRAVLFTQQFRVPPIEEDAGGDAYLEGGFDLGEGKFHVDWLMRDQAERVCSSYWDVESALSDRDKDVNLALAPGQIAASDFESFREDAPVERAQDEPALKVKVLVNFAPPNANSAVLQPLDRNALLSILRSITRDPRIGQFSLVAFNLQEQRVIYRQDDASRIDYAALGEALDSLNLGTVDVKRLSQKHGETMFLAELLQRETGGDSRPDALVFAGPKAMLGRNVPGEELKKVGPVSYPLFYMNYNLHPETTPWRDAIGSVVRFFRGTEFTITRPRDMWFAVGEMISRIVQFKGQRSAAEVEGR
ncbi:MAG TPA: hypothetical protein VLH09_12650 [Bryobacteraceae bacterium]|nr:hypothetical protein [Bryobacteraceae bacterium]